MGIFDRILGASAPVHLAQSYAPHHDGRFHLLEARRGRGKSYGMTYWGYHWFVDRLPYMLDGSAPHSRWNANYALDLHRIAVRLCVEGHLDSISDALDIVHERIRYASTWDTFFESYDSLNELDESNRSLDAYQTKKSPLLSLAHDYHQQTRKHKNSQLYATQYLDWINTQTRKLFDLLWRAKVVRHKTQRGPDGLKTPIRFNYYGSDPYSNGVDAQTVRRADFKMVIPFDLGLARCYRSWEPIITFPGDVEPRWASFRDLSEHMLREGLRPAPALPPVDRLTLHRDFEAESARLDRLRRLVDSGHLSSADMDALTVRKDGSAGVAVGVL